MNCVYLSVDTVPSLCANRVCVACIEGLFARSCFNINATSRSNAHCASTINELAYLSICIMVSHMDVSLSV
jgi:hypothetical protein